VGKKLVLPVFGATEQKTPTKKPSADAARQRLGGRLEASDVGGARPGRVVSIGFPNGTRCAAVVLWCGAREAHVLLDGIRLRRMSPSDLDAHEGAVEEELAKIAADAHLFGLLVEGDDVRYADERGGLRDGRLVEKCRWGALVLRDDGAIVAVGFRKLWPAKASGAA
jgi:hypothetical protein